MEIDLCELKERVKDFLEGIQSKEELGKWAKKGYYDLLKGEYLELDKIVLYPFLRLLSTVHIVADDLSDTYPCTRQEVVVMNDVLQGMRDQCFSVNISIPWVIKDKDLGLDRNKQAQYLILNEIIAEYVLTKKLSKNQYQKCLDMLSLKEERQGTIQFVLDTYIRSFLQRNIDTETHDFIISAPMGLYNHSDQEKENSLIKIQKYLSCYVGSSSFEIDTIFSKGHYQVAFLLG